MRVWGGHNSTPDIRVPRASGKAGLLQRSWNRGAWEQRNQLRCDGPEGSREVTCRWAWRVSRGCWTLAQGLRVPGEELGIECEGHGEGFTHGRSKIKFGL